MHKYCEILKEVSCASRYNDLDIFFSLNNFFLFFIFLVLTKCKMDNEPNNWYSLTKIIKRFFILKPAERMKTKLKACDSDKNKGWKQSSTLKCVSSVSHNRAFLNPQQQTTSHWEPFITSRAVHASVVCFTLKSFCKKTIESESRIRIGRCGVKRIVSFSPKNFKPLKVFAMIRGNNTTNTTLLKYSVLLFWVAAHLYLSFQVINFSYLK